MKEGERYRYFYRKSKEEENEKEKKTKIDNIDLYNYFRHISGLKYYINEKPYKTDAFCEITVVQKAMSSVKSWLLEKSIEMICYSEKDGDIIRVN